MLVYLALLGSCCTSLLPWTSGHWDVTLRCVFAGWEHKPLKRFQTPTINVRVWCQTLTIKEQVCLWGAAILHQRSTIMQTEKSITAGAERLISPLTGAKNRPGIVKDASFTFGLCLDMSSAKPVHKLCSAECGQTRLNAHRTVMDQEWATVAALNQSIAPASRSIWLFSALKITFLL